MKIILHITRTLTIQYYGYVTIHIIELTPFFNFLKLIALKIHFSKENDLRNLYLYYSLINPIELELNAL